MGNIYETSPKSLGSGSFSHRAAHGTSIWCITIEGTLPQSNYQVEQIIDFHFFSSLSSKVPSNPQNRAGHPIPRTPCLGQQKLHQNLRPGSPHMQASILAWILINIINHYSANIFTFAFNAQRNLVENVIILMLPMKNQGPEELIYPKSQSQWVAELGPKFSSDSHSCLLVRLVVQQHCPIELSVMIEMFYICTVCMVATSQMRLWAHVASTAKDLNLFILLNFN